jgi:uncharacterized repeat protein (TIGR02543 family)
MPSVIQTFYRCARSLSLLGLATLALTACGGSGGGGSGSGAASNGTTIVASSNAQSFTLAVSRSGQGTVTSSPAGINCGATCSASLTDGASVTLTAVPGSGYTFSGWSGACSGTGTCSLTISADTAVTATFTANGGGTYALSVSKVGTGTIASSPAGIDCGATCGASFASGTSVTLTATPGSGYSFSGWSGACGGTGTCTVAMSAARTVAATFTASGTGGGGTSGSLAIGAHTFKADASGSGTSPMTTPAVTTRASGSLILVQVLTQNTGTFAGLTDNKGNTYVNVGGARTYVGGGAGSYLFKAENAVGGAGHTWSLIKTAGYQSNEATIFVVEITGAPASNAIDGWTYLGSSSYGSAPVATTAANGLLVSFWGPADYNGSNNTYTPPAGWTKLNAIENPVSHNSGASAWRSTPTANSYDCTWNAALNISANSSAWLVAVKP